MAEPKDEYMALFKICNRVLCNKTLLQLFKEEGGFALLVGWIFNDGQTLSQQTLEQNEL